MADILTQEEIDQLLDISCDEIDTDKEEYIGEFDFKEEKEKEDIESFDEKYEKGNWLYESHFNEAFELINHLRWIRNEVKFNIFITVFQQNEYSRKQDLLHKKFSELTKDFTKSDREFLNNILYNRHIFYTRP